MPFTRGDADIFDEIAAEIDPEDLPEGFADKRPTDQFEYARAKATVKPAKLGKLARTVLELLLEAGATEFRVKYDGGFDEGFSYPEYVVLGEARCPVNKIAQKLAKSKPAISQLKKGIDKRMAEHYKGKSDLELAKSAIEELAHELASALLGDGYGTGEYQLYGAFTADLKRGKITDDPKAAKPKNMK
jgi:hypothetical protein